MTLQDRTLRSNEDNSKRLQPIPRVFNQNQSNFQAPDLSQRIASRCAKHLCDAPDETSPTLKIQCCIRLKSAIEDATLIRTGMAAWLDSSGRREPVHPGKKIFFLALQQPGVRTVAKKFFSGAWPVDSEQDRSHGDSERKATVAA